MNSKSKLVLLALIVLTVLVYNWNEGSRKSSAQLDFEKWLNAVEPELAPSNESIPQLSLSLVNRDLNLNLIVDRDNRDKVLRLFQLLREANLFSLHGLAATPDKFQLKISSKNKEFQIAFDKNQIKKNMPARNFLKLLQLYAPTQLASQKMDENSRYGS